MGHYFGTDGVRGKANQGLTVHMALMIGQALGAILPRSQDRGWYGYAFIVGDVETCRFGRFGGNVSPSL
jgi:phosphomannomutase